MAGTGTTRIIELTEASTVQSGDFIAVDSNARGTKKVSTDTLATSAALTAETNARAGADEQMSERMDGIEEQTALIQNPTKTLSGALVSFTDGADMPMVACRAEIVPKQSGTGTPSPNNVRAISGWTEVKVIVSPTQEATDGHTTTTSLGRTVYGGTLDVVSGVLTVDRAMVELGTLEWRYSDGLFSAQVPNFATPSSYSERKEGFILSVYSADTQVTISANAMTDGTALRVDGRIYIKDTRYTDATAFKSAVSGVQLCYELATPQTYTLTGQEISTLLGENNVWADSGDVEITYRRDISIVINNLESALNG